MYHLCITEIISAVLNDRLFLLVMICRSILLTIRQSPLLINTIKLSKRDEQNVNFTEKHLTKQGYFDIKRVQQS